MSVMPVDATSAGPDLSTIIAWLHQRRSGSARILQTMREVKDTYNAEIAIPLPELYSNEEAAVANLLHQGLDGNAQRIASTMPDVQYPSARPGFKVWDEAARTRRRWMLGVWEMNGMKRVMYRRARHLCGYAMSPVMIRPSVTNPVTRLNRAIPVWWVRDPMNTYPAPSSRLDEVAPSDVIFTFTRPLRWLRSMYPEQVARLDVGDLDEDSMLECVEYVDAEVIVLAVMGQSGGGEVSPTLGSQAGAYRDTRTGRRTGRQRFGVVGGSGAGWSDAEELERRANRAGMCLAVVPGRITLDRLQGQFDGMIGKYIRQARLDALELRAIEEGIYPRQWLIGRQGELPRVVKMANGRKGVVGITTGGEIHVQNLNPGYKTSEAIDRLTMAQRQEGGVPSEWGGESGTNIRTGRRGDQVLSAQIDFNIQEHQVILEASVEQENTVAVAVRKGWFAGRPACFWVNWDGSVDGDPDIKRGQFETIFSTSRNVVKYAMAGSDLNGQIVRVGQKLGTGLWSLQTAREQDPETPDPELEHSRTITEGLERALLTGVETQIQAGTISGADVAAMLIAMRGKPAVEFPDTYVKVHEQAQQRQAASVPPGSPEAQPGLAPPGSAGAEAGVAIPPPGPSLQDLNQRLGQLGRVRATAAAGEKSGVFVPQGQ